MTCALGSAKGVPLSIRTKIVELVRHLHIDQDPNCPMPPIQLAHLDAQVAINPRHVHVCIFARVRMCLFVRARFWCVPCMTSYMHP